MLGLFDLSRRVRIVVVNQWVPLSKLGSSVGGVIFGARVQPFTLDLVFRPILLISRTHLKSPVRVKMILIAWIHLLLSVSVFSGAIEVSWVCAWVCRSVLVDRIPMLASIVVGGARRRILILDVGRGIVMLIHLMVGRSLDILVLITWLAFDVLLRRQRLLFDCSVICYLLGSQVGTVSFLAEISCLGHVQIVVVQVLLVS